MSEDWTPRDIGDGKYATWAVYTTTDGERRIEIETTSTQGTTGCAHYINLSVADLEAMLAALKETTT